MLLQKDTDNSMNRASKHQGSLTENGNRKYTTSESAEIYWTDNEGGLQKVNPHGAYCGQDK